MRFDKKQGFTLIELLVVIAIIGLLAGVVFASMNSARIKSRKAAALSACRGIISVLSECLNDRAGITDPGTGTGGGTACTPSGGSSTNWPTIPSTWAYGGWSTTLGTSFSFTMTGDSATITGTEGGCTKPSGI